MMDVHRPIIGERRDAMRKLCCLEEGRNVDLKFVKPGNIGGDTGYVKSLNCLPNVNFEEDAKEDFVKPHNVPVVPKEGQKGFTIAGGDDSDDDNDDDGYNVSMEENRKEEEIESIFQNELTHYMSKLLRGRFGIPIP